MPVQDLSSAIVKFKDAMRTHGLEPHDFLEIEVDAGLQRFRVKGDKSGSKNGYYSFFAYPVPAGFYGSWKAGVYETWVYTDSSKPITYNQKQELKRVQIEKQKEREKARQENYIEAAKRSRDLWQKARPASTNHPYLYKKRMAATGLKQLRKTIVVPLFNNKDIATLQFINEDGSKRFKTGGKIKGSYFLWGSVKKKYSTLYIAEGISTGYAVYILSHYQPVFCAMNAGNLEPVALAVRTHFPDVNIVIAADNDIDGDRNTGVEAANSAAAACNGRVTVPHNLYGTKCDWSDLYVMALARGEP